MTTKKKLGDLLLEQKIIDEIQLKSALGHQKKWGCRLGTALLDLGFVSEDTLTKFLSSQLKVPGIDLARARIPAEAFKMIPKDIATKYSVVPLEIKDTPGKKTLIVATCNPTDLASMDELEFMTRCKISPRVAPESIIKKRIQYYGEESLNVPVATESPRLNLAEGETAIQGESLIEPEELSLTEEIPSEDDAIVIMDTPETGPAAIQADEGDIVVMADAPGETIADYQAPPAKGPADTAPPSDVQVLPDELSVLSALDAITEPDARAMESQAPDQAPAAAYAPPPPPAETPAPAPHDAPMEIPPAPAAPEPMPEPMETTPAPAAPEPMPEPMEASPPAQSGPPPPELEASPPAVEEAPPAHMGTGPSLEEFLPRMDAIVEEVDNLRMSMGKIQDELGKMKSSPEPDPAAADLSARVNAVSGEVSALRVSLDAMQGGLDALTASIKAIAPPAVPEPPAPDPRVEALVGDMAGIMATMNDIKATAARVLAVEAPVQDMKNIIQVLMNILMDKKIVTRDEILNRLKK